MHLCLPSAHGSSPVDALLFVKLLRIWLLVLLAVSLPVRGVMAATMLCAPTGGAVHTEANSTGHEDGHHHDDQTLAAAGPSHGQAHDDHGMGAHDAASHDRCNVCTSSCSSPPLPSAAADIAEPVALTSVSFPDLSVPAPTFQSDGQERPPRTI